MNIKEASLKIAELEERYDTSSVRYGDQYVWPSIRICIWYILKKKNPPKLALIKSLIGLILRAVSSLVHLSKPVNHQIPEADYILVTTASSYLIQANNKRYSPLIDPVLEVLSRNNSTIKLDEENSKDLKNLYPAPVVNLNHTNFIDYLKAIQLVLINRPFIISICRDLDIHFLHLAISVIKRMVTTYAAERAFTRVIKRINPKAVFLICYYTPQNMGIISAARKRKIASIDIQHGKQGKYQGAYTHWNSIPPGGYDHLPDYFWVWGVESKDNIMQNSPERKNHVAVIGGLPWIDRFRRSEEFNSIPDWLNVKMEGKKVILVSLQAKLGSLKRVVPDELATAIEDSPDNWLWLLRRHHNHMYVKDEVLASLEGAADHKYIIDNLNEIPLYSLLKIADYHITAYSSVLYEAEAFGINSSVFSQDALDLFKQEISDGRFQHFDSGERLIQQVNISLDNKLMKWTGPKYIETGDKLAEKAFSTILSNGSVKQEQ